MSATGAERAAARYKKSAVALLLAAAAMYAAGDMYLSNFVLQVTYTDIRLRTLPPGFAGFRICHLSDLHGASFGRTNGTLMRKIASENPDIICITGDFADSTRQLEWAAGTLAALRDIAPVYYVTGNHEWGAAPGEGGETLVQGLRRLMADLDCVYLDNGHVTLERDGGELIICGLVDPNGPADSLLVTPVINKARAQGAVSPLIVLSHR
ncbi:MAG: metallophosphoesterase, partial [Oscillospiraceae bacterium]|nr:metallophosphoesterase [Oscillospiraceae bacterium]